PLQHQFAGELGVVEVQEAAGPQVARLDLARDQAGGVQGAAVGLQPGGAQVEVAGDAGVDQGDAAQRGEPGEAHRRGGHAVGGQGDAVLCGLQPGAGELQVAGDAGVDEPDLPAFDGEARGEQAGQGGGLQVEGG